MSTIYAKKFFGFNVSEFELLQLPHPKIELTIHVTFKTIQFGTMIGSLIIAPFIQTMEGPRTMDDYRRSMVRGGLLGFQTGLLVGPLMAWVQSKKMSQFELYDRCYRLRFNVDEMNIDRFSLLGAVVGTGLTCSPMGLVFGIDIGVALANLYNKIRKQR